MAFVKVDETEPLEKSIKRFKRMVEKEGIIREWKKRQYFEKPSTILNRKKKALARKQLKKVSARSTLPRPIEPGPQMRIMPVSVWMPAFLFSCIVSVGLEGPAVAG